MVYLAFAYLVYSKYQRCLFPFKGQFEAINVQTLISISPLYKSPFHNDCFENRNHLGIY